MPSKETVLQLNKTCKNLQIMFAAKITA